MQIHVLQAIKVEIHGWKNCIYKNGMHCYIYTCKWSVVIFKMVYR